MTGSRLSTTLFFDADIRSLVCDLSETSQPDWQEADTLSLSISNLCDVCAEPLWEITHFQVGDLIRLRLLWASDQPAFFFFCITFILHIFVLKTKCSDWIGPNGNSLTLNSPCTSAKPSIAHCWNSVLWSCNFNSLHRACRSCKVFSFPRMFVSFYPLRWCVCVCVVLLFTALCGGSCRLFVCKMMVSSLVVGDGSSRE